MYKMEWQEVHTQVDIERLFNLYKGFHVSCLVDLYISTEDFVENKLAMNFEEKITPYLLFLATLWHLMQASFLKLFY